ncbi:MAG: hypothetical protein ABIN13_15705 [Mucilaginibacter sp.]
MNFNPKLTEDALMSPIPNFNHNHVIPPHLGNPVNSSDLSPYTCTILEFCYHFAISKKRIEILKGYLTFRQRMASIGITQGFQWLDGSFLENIEVSETRDPNDLDLVTFYNGTSSPDITDIKLLFPEFSSPSLSKANYKLDHYTVDFTYRPLATIELTRYWIQLFTHNRAGVWKGILHLPLNTGDDDRDALEYLNGLDI